MVEGWGLFLPLCVLNILLSPKVAIFHNDSFRVDLLKVIVTTVVPKNGAPAAEFALTCYLRH